MTKTLAVASHRSQPVRREAWAQWCRCAQRPAGVSNRALQAKLRVGPANDPLERAADRAADRVLAGGPAGALGRAGLGAQRACAACAAEQRETLRRQPVEGEEQDEEQIQAKAEVGGPHAAGAEAAAAAVASGGRQLSPGLRAYFEPRFGRDLADVRVHDHARAAGAARAIGARAYTLGRDVAFAPGAWAPASDDGRRLIAHELAHVVQQGSGRAAVVRRQGDPDLPLPPDFAPPERRLPPMIEIVETPDRAEPGCPRPPTNLGNLTPVPPCAEDGEDIDGKVFYFCPDSDVFLDAADLENFRSFVQGKLSGTQFRVRGYASVEGPGTAVQADAYNRRLTCHRTKRMVRELINAGVQETQIEAVSLGPTERFGAGRDKRPLNRVAVVEAVPPTRRTTPPDGGGTLTPAQVRDRARQLLVAGNYLLGADAYLARWSCGRFHNLSDAVSRTSVQMEGVDFGGSVTELGTIGRFGANTIKLSSSVTNATDPTTCAANRIADLTFHHFARPQLPAFGDQHRAGLHLVHLAGLPACTMRRDPLGLDNDDISVPLADDPFLGFQPACADMPLPGPIGGRGHPSRAETSPTFTAGPIRLDGGSGSISGALDPAPSRPGAPTVGVEMSRPMTLTGKVTASGDAATIATYEVGFVQTAMAEDWLNTYVDGRRERRRLPLPLRDGPGRDDPLSDPPWFARLARVQAQPGDNDVTMTDAPNFRAFRVLPDLSTTRFVRSFDLPPATGGTARRHDFAVFEPQATHPNNVPDRGHREIEFNTWLVARQANPRAPATLDSTVAIAGVRMTLRHEVNWVVDSSGRIEGNGTFTVSSQPAAESDAAMLVLRGATAQDFVSPQGVPLFNEFLETQGPLPRVSAGGLARNAYFAAVRKIVAPHRTTPRLRERFVVRIKVDMATGRVILDTPALEGRAIEIVPSETEGGPINPGEARTLARAIFPEVRKLVLRSLTSTDPESGVVTVPVVITAEP